MELHPQILQKNGKNEFVVLPYEEFEALRELAEDYEDLYDLREAKAQERNAPTLMLAEARVQLGLR
jgi:PHD/YefM family antitoxin component YafN of YafNO toxin-antitoxin module